MHVPGEVWQVLAPGVNSLAGQMRHDFICLLRAWLFTYKDSAAREEREESGEDHGVQGERKAFIHFPSSIPIQIMTSLLL